jgi:hypothetical protein
MELLILVFFALVGVFLLRLLAGGGDEDIPPQPVFLPPQGPSPYDPYSGQQAWPPATGYYQPPPQKAPKRKIIVMPEKTVSKRRKRRRRI